VFRRYHVNTAKNIQAGGGCVLLIPLWILQYQRIWYKCRVKFL
jgi:hypothetical protein